MSDQAADVGDVNHCNKCGEDLGASFYSDVPGHGDLCNECHVDVHGTNHAEDLGEFPGDVRARKITSLDRAAMVIDGARTRLVKCMDRKRKVGMAMADELEEIAGVVSRLQDAIEYLSSYDG